MSENYRGKFVASVKPAAEMGWWIGEILANSGRFYKIRICWSTNNPSQNLEIYSRQKDFKVFAIFSEALGYFAKKGIVAEVPA